MYYMGTQLPPPQRGTPNFGPCLLWPNGWLHQDATWYGCRPRPRPHCVRWRPRPLPSKRGKAPQFTAHVSCGQTVGWIKMKLGTQVGFDPATLCQIGTQLPQKRGTALPQFSAHVRCGQTAGWTKMPLGMEIGLGPGEFVLDGDPAPPQERHRPFPPNFRPMSIVAK